MNFSSLFVQKFVSPIFFRLQDFVVSATTQCSHGVLVIPLNHYISYQIVDSPNKAWLYNMDFFLLLLMTRTFMEVLMGVSGFDKYVC